MLRLSMPPTVQWYGSILNNVLTSGKNSRKNSRKQREHKAKTSRERKTCEFYEELSDCLGDNPKIIPVATVSSAKAVASMNQREEASSNDESSTLNSTSPKKRRKETLKKRKRSKSSASEMIDFLKEFRQDKKEDQERVILIERMHADKMKVMERFLSIMDKKQRLPVSLFYTNMVIAIQK